MLKRITIKSKSIYYMRMFFCILLTFFVSALITSSVSSGATLKVKYNNKTYKYTGRQITSYANGKKVKSDGTKGIIMNKNVMVSYKDVFKTSCGVKVKYTKSTGKLVFTANGKTVKMTVGKKTCTVNGKKQKLKQAPLKVKYIKKKKTKILVPAKVVAKGLGFTYAYNSSENNITLLSPFVLKYNKAEHIYKSYQGGLVFDNVTADVSKMPLFKINSTIMMAGAEVLSDIMGLNYQYNYNEGSIFVSNDFYSLSMTVNNTNAVLTDLQNGNTTTNIVFKTAPLIVVRKDTSYNTVMLPASQVLSSLGYYYKWDSNLKIANVHTKTYFNWKAKDNTYDTAKYKNALSQLTTTYDYNNNNTVITFNFLNPISESDCVITEDYTVNSIYLKFADIYNLIADNGKTISAQNLNSVISGQVENTTQITLTVNDKVSYYHSISGNTYTLYISQTVNKDYGMRISKPAEVDYGTVLLEDLYTSNKFVISLPGNYVDYYVNNPIQKHSSAITNIATSYDAISNLTKITVTTSKLQGSKLVNMGSYIGVIVDAPANVYKNIVVLDAGHGGKDPGASNKGYNESDINYQIMYQCAKSYFDAPDSTVKAYWTRTTDVFITLEDRAKFASKMGAELFVSLHMNSSNNSSAKGTEVYYCNNNNTTNSFGINSYKLATKCLDKIVPAISTSTRGVKSNNYYVLNHNTVPAVLIELGFISNSDDLSKITNAEIQKTAAKAIYDAVAEAFSSKL